MKTQRKLALTNLQAAQSRAALKFLVCRIELKNGRPEITDSYILNEGFSDMVYFHCSTMGDYRFWLNFEPWELVQNERKRLTGSIAPKPHTCGKMYVWTYEAYEVLKSMYMNTKPKTPKF